MSSNRATIIEVSLVLAAAVLLVLLFSHSYQQPAAPLTLSIDETTTGMSETWSGIYVGEQKIGHSLSRSGKTENGDLLLQERTMLKLMLLGEPNDITIATDLELASSGRLRSLLAQVRTEVKGLPVSLRAQGKAVGDGMNLELFQAGKALTTLTLDEVPTTSATLYRTVISRQLQVGSRVTVPFFNPLTLGHSEASVTVLGHQDAQLPDGTHSGAWLLEVDNGGQKLEALIADDGRRIRERELDGGLGMELRLEDRETALHSGWPGDIGDSVDLIALSSIPVDRPLPGGGRDLTDLRLRLSGPANISRLLTAAHGDNWNAEAKELRLHSSLGPAEQSYTLPNGERAQRPWLRSTTFVASDDPVIRRVAGEIIGAELDSIDAARRLNHWVYQEIDKVPVAGFPESREILRSRRGDCNEHTTLFTALARAVGLPTRMAAGIVYSESIFSDGAFYYHAWPEVWLGEQWLAIDPTFDQFPADATHVKLVEGALDQQVELMSAVGRLKIEVLEPE
jgi:transglutaminase-like putative cysteine protease